MNYLFIVSTIKYEIIIILCVVCNKFLGLQTADILDTTEQVTLNDATSKSLTEYSSSISTWREPISSSASPSRSSSSKSTLISKLTISTPDDATTTFKPPSDVNIGEIIYICVLVVVPVVGIVICCVKCKCCRECGWSCLRCLKGCCDPPSTIYSIGNTSSSEREKKEREERNSDHAWYMQRYGIR